MPPSRHRASSRTATGCRSCAARTSITLRWWRWTRERGDILAYVGSAGYYRNDLASSKLEPKFDVAGQGYRQPGSAWKPIEYAAGFDAKKVTPGTLLLDVTTEFSPAGCRATPT